MLYSWAGARPVARPVVLARNSMHANGDLGFRAPTDYNVDVNFSAAILD